MPPRRKEKEQKEQKEQKERWLIKPNEQKLFRASIAHARRGSISFFSLPRLFVSNHLTSWIKEQITEIMSLPPGLRFIPALSVEIIQDGHIPAALVGEKGVRARQDLPVGTVMGEYEGETRLVNKRDDETNDNAYLYAIAPKNAQQKRNLLIDGTKQSNGVLEYINDFRVNVSNLNSPANRKVHMNCEFIDVSVEGVHRAFFIVNRPVAKGAWLSTDYGTSYWKNPPAMDVEPETPARVSSIEETRDKRLKATLKHVSSRPPSRYGGGEFKKDDEETRPIRRYWSRLMRAPQK